MVNKSTTAGSQPGDHGPLFNRFISRAGLLQAALLAIAATGSAGCAQIFGLDNQYVDTGKASGGAAGSSGGSSGAAGGGTAGSGGIAGAGGTGGVAPCTVAADCPDPGACKMAACTAGVCQPGSEPSGTMCSSSGGKVCDGMGTCVACLVDSDCATGMCMNNACQSMCMDGVQNGAETGIDCGGGCSKKCDLGIHCKTTDDCVSGHCGPTNLCEPDTCYNNQTDPGESDLNCGGGGCSPCLGGQHCDSPMNCLSDQCPGSHKCTPGSYCMDGFEDQLETDKNCGGGTCPACLTGQKCLTGQDCIGGKCEGDVCVPTCSDQAQNQGETDFDCGGVNCGPCATGKKCMMDSDCLSMKCTGNICTVSCMDKIQNNGETDVDCGGLNCPTKCADGLMCKIDTDCAVNFCSLSFTCGPKDCIDSVKNGAETDVDCGGGTCKRCEIGKACMIGSDCVTGNCAGTCI